MKNQARHQQEIHDQQTDAREEAREKNSVWLAENDPEYQREELDSEMESLRKETRTKKERKKETLHQVSLLDWFSFEIELKTDVEFSTPNTITTEKIVCSNLVQMGQVIISDLEDFYCMKRYTGNLLVQTFDIAGNLREKTFFSEMANGNGLKQTSEAIEADRKEIKEWILDSVNITWKEYIESFNMMDH